MPMKFWTMSTIARVAGVSRQAVSLWVKKGDFPPPVGEIAETERGPVLLWTPDDVEAWLQKNRPNPS